jgi:hypothetical protein
LGGNEVRVKLRKIGGFGHISCVLGGTVSELLFREDNRGFSREIKVEVLGEVKRSGILAWGSSRAVDFRAGLAAIRVAAYAQSLTEDSVGLDSLLDVRVKSVLNLDFGSAGKMGSNEAPSVTNLFHKTDNELIFSIVPVSASDAGSKLVEKTISNLLAGSAWQTGCDHSPTLSVFGHKLK